MPGRVSQTTECIFISIRQPAFHNLLMDSIRKFCSVCAMMFSYCSVLLGNAIGSLPSGDEVYGKAVTKRSRLANEKGFVEQLWPNKILYFPNVLSAINLEWLDNSEHAKDEMTILLVQLSST